MSIATLERDPRYRVDPDGTVIGARGRALRPETLKGGYQRVVIGKTHVLVHVLVAETFIGPKPAEHEVNHRDGNTKNNAVSNLEYLTRPDNVRHSIDVLHTERAPGEKNGNAKLTNRDVAEMRRMFAVGASIAGIAGQFDINTTHAWRVVTHRAWRHIK